MLNICYSFIGTITWLIPTICLWYLVKIFFTNTKENIIFFNKIYHETNKVCRLFSLFNWNLTFLICLCIDCFYTLLFSFIFKPYFFGIFSFFFCNSLIFSFLLSFLFSCLLASIFFNLFSFRIYYYLLYFS